MTTSTRSSSSNTTTTHETTNNQQQQQQQQQTSNNNNTNSSTNRVMQADEDFNIRFVNLVRTHKCLYDKKVPEYRNRDNQEKAWVLISEETRESVIHCKERWRNLRACLSRYIKQQSGSEPQHKPYYLTEHMAFLLPFLKSTRNSLEGNNSLATLYQLSQQHHQQQQLLYCNNNNNNTTSNNNNNLEEALELKQSLSENDDEETMDAFDPAIAASLGLQRVSVGTSSAGNTSASALPLVNGGGLAMAKAGSPARSETASANSLQNFIPDVQLAESGQDLIYHHPLSHYEPSAKRIKTECEATTTTSGGGYFGGLNGHENADMEFFRSILPDIAALTPQQRRKFKIGILELIDDVVERYPERNQEHFNGTTVNGENGTSAAPMVSVPEGRIQRRSAGRDWRK